MSYSSNMLGAMCDSGDSHAIFGPLGFRLYILKRQLSFGEYVKEVMDYANDNSLDYDKSYAVVVRKISTGNIVRARFYNAADDGAALDKVRTGVKNYLKNVLSKTEAQAEDIVTRGKVAKFRAWKGSFSQAFDNWRSFT